MTSTELWPLLITLTLIIPAQVHNILQGQGILWYFRLTFVFKFFEVVPTSHLTFGRLIDLDDFYWIVTFTCDLDLSSSRSLGILG